MLKNFYIILLVQLLFVFLLDAQSYDLVKYTTNDGLPQMQCITVLEDANGYIWVGTKDGAAKFDGHHFKSYRRPQGLEQIHIREIAECLDNKLLIRTTSHVYNVDGDKLEKVLLTDPMEGDRIIAIDKHRFAILNQNEILLVNHNFEIIDTIHPKLELSIKTGIYIKETEEFLLNTKQIGIVKITLDAEFKVVKSDHPVSSIRFIKNHDRWIEEIHIPKEGKEDVLLIDHETQDTLFEYYADLDKINKPKVSIEMPVRVNLNRLIFYNKTNNSFDFEITSPTISYARKTIKDRNDNIWIADESGLIKITPENKFDIFDGKAFNDTWTFNKIDDENYISSSFARGIFKIKGQLENPSEVIRLNSHKRTNYGSIIDFEKNILIPSYGGFIKIDSNSKLSFKPFHPKEKYTSLIAKKDSVNQQIIFGTKEGFISMKNDEFDYRKDTSDLIKGFVLDLEFKNKDELYLGSIRSFGSYNFKTEEFNSLKHLFEDPEQAGAITIYTDNLGNLWIGNKLGLFCLPKGKQKIIRIEEDLINRLVLSINSCKDLLLVGTSIGFYTIKLNEVLFDAPIIKEYNFRNGFKGQEVAQNGIQVYGEEIWIPSTTVISRTSYERLEESSKENIFLNINLLNEKNAKTKDILFDKNDYSNFINVQYGTVGSYKSLNQVYSVQLLKNNNVHSDWSDWSNKENVVYTNLGSGNYIVNVKTRNRTNSIIRDSTKFTIDLPLHKEPRFPFYAIAIIFLLGLLGCIAFYQSIKARNKQLEIKRKLGYLEIATTQSQLNPHFIFNVLSSIQYQVSKKETKKAEESIIKLSILIRNFLESSIRSTDIINYSPSENEISVKQEVELIKLYVDFELLQYKDKFDFFLEIDDAHDIMNFKIPPMIIQPYVENAIKHGLLHKTEKGNLTIKLYGTENHLNCEIIDDGIGRKESDKLQQKSDKIYKSRGTELVSKRIELLNNFQYKIDISTIDNHPQGTNVKISFSYAEK